VNKKGTVSCKGRASFSSQAILTLKDLLNEKKERSGKIIMRENKPLLVIDVDMHRTKVGKQGETDSVDYRYTYHTHPRQSYINNDTDLGFPSSSDFEVFIESFIDFQNIFHVLSSLEGLYIILINPYFFKDKIGKRKAFAYIKKYFEIDKQGFRRTIGINKFSFLIRTPRDFVRYVNSRPFERGKNLFTMYFMPWTSHRTFNFYYPKINNQCIVNDKSKIRKFKNRFR